MDSTGFASADRGIMETVRRQEERLAAREVGNGFDNVGWLDARTRH
jgi:hypothetical protein